MKSRWTTYLLMVVVAAVWGIVAWKIFAPADNTAPAVRSEPSVPVVQTAPADTLLLDYPDPFLRAVATRPSVPASTSAKAPVRSKAKNERPAAKLACTGRIRKEGTDHYLISIDGRVHLLRQGESAGGFTLRQIRNDSLVMVRDTECYLVKIP